MDLPSYSLPFGVKNSCEVANEFDKIDALQRCILQPSKSCMLWDNLLLENPNVQLVFTSTHSCWVLHCHISFFLGGGGYIPACCPWMLVLVWFCYHGNLWAPTGVSWSSRRLLRGINLRVWMMQILIDAPHEFTHLANGPWNKGLNFTFPTKYVIPKSLKFSHWPSKFNIIPEQLPSPTRIRSLSTIVFQGRS